MVRSTSSQSHQSRLSSTSQLTEVVAHALRPSVAPTVRAAGMAVVVATPRADSSMSSRMQPISTIPDAMTTGMCWIGHSLTIP